MIIVVGMLAAAATTTRRILIGTTTTSSSSSGSRSRRKRRPPSNRLVARAWLISSGSSSASSVGWWYTIVGIIASILLLSILNRLPVSEAFAIRSASACGSGAIATSTTASTSSDSRQSSCTSVVGRRMSLSDEEADEELEGTSQQRPHVLLRVLALHGSGGNAQSMTETLQSTWGHYLSQQQLDDPHDDAVLEITAIPAHVPKEDGFAWWSMPPGVRSSTATSYQGFDISRGLVLNAIQQHQEQQQGPFDLIIGHSQGAILLAALLALDLLPAHPKVGYILNGVAWPNPYTEQLETLKRGNKTRASNTRILVLVGERDRMNPPEQGHRVAGALERAGYAVTVLDHPGGHAIPTDKDGTWEAIQKWIKDVQV